ncbi:hypothetical protein [Listeria grandensis]|uniref:hypothetical protein n=1 Tax=Listeria grandensis TaxID=1494963 RepID=UPI00164DC0F9|nr:hypothetical protein [Listeria grandensis]MBC6315544.1 hypothetical protein [Listeria grandensis]
MLNNREIAIIVWGTIFIICLLVFPKNKKDIRNSLIHVFRAWIAFCKIGIVKLFFLYEAFIMIIVAILIYANNLDWNLLKDILIYLVIGFFPFFNSIGKMEGGKLLKSQFLSIFRFSIVPLFVIANYPFGLWIELILVPMATFIVLLQVVAEKQKEKGINKLLRYLIGYMGLLIFLYALVNFFNHFEDIRDINFWLTFCIEFFGLVIQMPIIILMTRFIEIERRMVFYKKRSTIAGIKQLIAEQIDFISVNKSPKIKSFEIKEIEQLAKMPSTIRVWCYLKDVIPENVERDIIVFNQQLNSTKYIKKIFKSYKINSGADIIYIYFGTDQLDFDYCLWKCESIWCYSKVEGTHTPYKLKGKNEEDKTLICWNPDYNDSRKVYEGFVK